MPDQTFRNECAVEFFQQELSAAGVGEYCKNMQAAVDDCTYWYVSEQGSKIKNAQEICKNLISGSMAAGKQFIIQSKSIIKDIRKDSYINKMPIWEIVAISAGALAGTVLIGTTAALCCKKKKEKEKSISDSWSKKTEMRERMEYGDFETNTAHKKSNSLTPLTINKTRDKNKARACERKAVIL